MFNDWFSIGPLTVHGYGVMIAVGILAASWLATKLCKEYKLDYENIDSFIIFVIVIGYAFSKLTYCLTVFDQFLSDPLSVLGSGGWVVYGGILGGLLAALIWCKWKKWKFMDYFQVLMPCVSLAQGFGRIGCLLAGCCYGRETDSIISVTFQNSDFAPNHVALIPTQLYSSILDFLHFGILLYIARRKKADGQVAAFYLIFYSIGRFVLEFFRGDLIRGSVGSLSTSQFISLFILAAGIAILITRTKKKNA